MSKSTRGYSMASCVVLWGAIFAVACGDEKGAEADATTTDVTQDIQSDADAVEPVDGEVIASNFCIADGDCDAGEVCDCHGECVAAGEKACTEDRNCGVPRWCNTCTGFCEAQVGVCEACSESRGCLDQGACLPYASGEQVCGLGCVTDAGCAEGFACRAVVGVDIKQCVAKSGVCEDLGLCRADTECPIGQICSDATRACAQGCAEDGQCQQGTVCVAGRCAPPCVGAADCTAPATCDAGKCKIPGACEAAADCPAPATYCSRTTGQCEDGCVIDADCKDAAKVCDGGSCIDKGCLHNFECAFGRVCDKASGACVPFPASEPHCAECNAEAETNPGCGAPNQCVRFVDDEDVPQGDHCLVQCADDPIDRCPSGWSCKKFEDPEGGAEQFLCTRLCYIDPVAP